MPGSERYTVTIYIAAPGTPLLDSKGHTSGIASDPGHMFYAISNGVDEPRSYGFAPVQHGSMDGPGHIAHDDVQTYKDPVYSRTMEISQDQYETLRSFGDRPDQFGFDTRYRDVRNNCVDFAWAALNQASIRRQDHTDVLPPIGIDVRIPLPNTANGKSALRPTQNITDVKSITDPMLGSPLNREHTNPMPARNIKQWLMSEPALDNPKHPGHTLYQQAYAGVAKLNAQHQVPPSDRDKDFAASLAVNAKAQGLDRIDHVLLSPDGNQAFAVQVNLTSPHDMNRQIASLPTMEALNTPLSQSSASWSEATEQGSRVQSETQAQQSLAQNDAQPQGPVMRLRF
ncbi:XVIPCD domain-containing protein [Ralstonia pseudosolanacearum]|uniref:XVIPCD domain-containing protein n=1 Tax=Ralstonia pseudosolanacearum TaxID=1310165 RepID=UPI004053F4F1